MAFIKLPHQDQLRQLLDYDPDTGLLFWRSRENSMFEPGRWSREAAAACWNGTFAGKEAFPQRSSSGYKRGCLLGRTVMAHRVAWKWWTGNDPAHVIDHINHVRTDNRIANRGHPFPKSQKSSEKFIQH